MFSLDTIIDHISDSKNVEGKSFFEKVDEVVQALVEKEMLLILVVVIVDKAYIKINY